MEIHKPKPWHGLREFAGEILVIVIGVLIALAAEQTAEAMRWRHEAAAAEEELKAPYAREVGNVALREAQAGCVDRRIAALRAVLEEAAANGRLPAIGPLGHPPHVPWTVETWDALVAAQTVTHMPRAKMFAYTRIRQSTAYLSGLSDQEDADWVVLDSLAGPGRRLSDPEAEELRLALARAASASREMMRVGARLQGFVRATGLVEPAVFEAANREAAREPGEAAICRPLAVGAGAR